jgi:hypothetical protein
VQFQVAFFNWLPDHIALLHASRSPRTEFGRTLSKATDPKETLYRLGRGVSYHEFDSAIGLSELKTINDGYSHLLTHRPISDVFEGVLLHAIEQFSLHIPPGFSKQYLEMIIRKRWHKIALLKPRHLVRDEMLDGTSPVLLLEGEEALLEYGIVGSKASRVTLAVLKDPWSSSSYSATWQAVLSTGRNSTRNRR